MWAPYKPGPEAFPILSPTSHAASKTMLLGGEPPRLHQPARRVLNKIKPLQHWTCLLQKLWFTPPTTTNLSDICNFSPCREIQSLRCALLPSSSEQASPPGRHFLGSEVSVSLTFSVDPPNPVPRCSQNGLSKCKFHSALSETISSFPVPTG